VLGERKQRFRGQDGKQQQGDSTLKHRTLGPAKRPGPEKNVQTSHGAACCTRNIGQPSLLAPYSTLRWCICQVLHGVFWLSGHLLCKPYNASTFIVEVVQFLQARINQVCASCLMHTPPAPVILSIRVGVRIWGQTRLHLLRSELWRPAQVLAQSKHPVGKNPAEL
jgi:hypothetical protein